MKSHDELGYGRKAPLRERKYVYGATPNYKNYMQTSNSTFTIPQNTQISGGPYGGGTSSNNQHYRTMLSQDTMMMGDQDQWIGAPDNFNAFSENEW